MELNMYLDDKLIDAIPVQLEQICIPGFLEGLKKQLEEKHQDLLASTSAKAVFFVDHVPSSYRFK